MRGGVGLEALVGVGGEGLGPGAGAEMEGAGEVGGDVGFEGLLRGGGEVADGADGAGLVLDLDHDDGVLRAVDGLEVLHEGGEGGDVGGEVVGGAGRHDVEQLAVCGLLARVGFGVGLDPLGDVVVLAVLPGAEPEEHEAEMVFARLVDEEVDVAEVEGALGGLHLLPVDGRLGGVDVHGLEGAPRGGEGGGPGAGVVDLRAEHEEWLAIDDHGEMAVALFNVGDVGGLGAGAGCCNCGEEKG